MKEGTIALLMEASKVAHSIGSKLESDHLDSAEFLDVMLSLENIRKAVEIAHDIEYGIG